MGPADRLLGVLETVWEANCVARAAAATGASLARLARNAPAFDRGRRDRTVLGQILEDVELDGLATVVHQGSRAASPDRLGGARLSGRGRVPAWTPAG